MDRGTPELVLLDRDHPGFRDPVYRARRNTIAKIAIEYQAGDPVPDAPYTEAEHGVWRDVWAQLGPLHQRRACHRYRTAEAALGLPRDRIPQLAEVNRSLGSGFQLAPVAGLVTAERFMVELSYDRFLATQYVRHHSRPFYTPEPDVLHELVGHGPTLLDPALAGLNRAFGQAARRAGPARIEALIRLYWYTLEFGLVREDGALKAWGAGLLSSFGELGDFDERAELLPFDLERITQTPFDPSDYQRCLFVAEDLDQAIASIERYLASNQDVPSAG